MSQIILIRHSISKQDDSLPANQWRLSQAGREACRPLAAALQPFSPTLLISSLEPKAIETARLTAAHLGVPSEMAAGLHEHDRSNLGYISQDRFQGLVREMMEKPEEQVFGLETGAQARGRFGAALEQLLAEYPEETLGLVTHGTVMSLYIAAANGLDTYNFWERLGMPSFVILTLPRLEIIEVADSI